MNDVINMSFSKLMEDIIPSCAFSKMKIERMAINSMEKGEDFAITADNIRYISPQSTIKDYFSAKQEKEEASVKKPTGTKSKAK